MNAATDSAAGRLEHHAQAVARINARILALFPRLEANEQTLAVALYRLLARQDSVASEELAAAAHLPPEWVRDTLAVWSGLYWDEGRVTGFWGLTARPVSKHRFTVNGRERYAWCAWDTLFLAEILGATLHVRSEDPHSAAPIALTVTPEGVQNVQPPGALLTLLAPPVDLEEDIRSKFCQFIHFFESPATAEHWAREHPDTHVLSLDEGFALGRSRNREQFGKALNGAQLEHGACGATR